MDSSVICKQCGGYIEYVGEVPDLRSLASVPRVRFCTGHTALKPKHDGRLDEQNDCRAFYRLVAVKDGNYQGICIESKWGDESTCLLPKQALSLLSWLQQEKAALEQLAEVGKA